MCGMKEYAKRFFFLMSFFSLKYNAFREIKKYFYPDFFNRISHSFFLLLEFTNCKFILFLIIQICLLIYVYNNILYLVLSIVCIVLIFYFYVIKNSLKIFFLIEFIAIFYLISTFPTSRFDS